ncbi:MAG TPA: AI-2E family transporter [Candidatus Nanopelagicales bacterium]|nr:AI-2E family transporter [Candidatus Nanopelagicales bacterium]
MDQPSTATPEPEADEQIDGRRPLTVAFEPRAFRNAVVWVFLIFVGYRIASWIWDSTAGFVFILLLAWLLSIAMEPAVAWLADHGWRRGLGTGVVLLGIFVAGAAFVAVFGSLFATQTADLVKSVPDLLVNIADWANQRFGTNFDPTHILDYFNLSAGTIATIGSDLAGGVLGILGIVFGGLFDVITMLVFAFYFSADAPRVRRVVGSWLPQRHQKVFLVVWDIAVVKTGGFVVSKVVLATLSAFFHSLFFYFIDIPYWLPMGIFAGVVSQFIPTIGTYIGVALPAVFAAFNDPWDVVWIIAFATVYQQIESYVFTPRVSRATMDVHPAIALASVFIGVALFGPIGAIIGIPLAAAIIAVIETYGQRYDLVPELRARSKGEKSAENDPLVDEHVELPAGTKLSQVEEEHLEALERADAIADAEEDA